MLAYLMKDELKNLVQNVMLPALDGLTYKDAQDVLTFCEEVLRHNLNKAVINFPISKKE